MDLEWEYVDTLDLVEVNPLVEAVLLGYHRVIQASEARWSTRAEVRCVIVVHIFKLRPF